MKFIFPMLVCALFFSSCTKENVVTNTVRSPFTLKYEIVCSNSIQTSFLGQQAFIPEIAYTNGTGQTEFSNSFTSGNNWSKTLTVTDTRRPFAILFGANNLLLSSAGSITGNIYINGEKKATVTNSTLVQGTLNFGILSMNYSVN